LGVAIAEALVPICACGLMLEQVILLASSMLFFTNHWNRFFRHSCISVGIKTQKKSQMVLLSNYYPSRFDYSFSLNYDKFSSGPQFQSSIYEKRGDFRKFKVLQP
jgi:hypothetical protein